MTRVIRIPKRFYDDCEDCGTGTPPIVRTTKAHYFVDIDCAFSLLEDFTSRAGVYQDSDGFDEYVLPICASARATLAALAKEQDWIDARIIANELDIAEIALGESLEIQNDYRFLTDSIG